jgi:hypothetical protein
MLRDTVGTRIEWAMLIGAHCNQARHVRDEVLEYLGNRRECSDLPVSAKCSTYSAVSKDKRDMFRHERLSSDTSQNTWLSKTHC